MKQALKTTNLNRHEPIKSRPWAATFILTGGLIVLLLSMGISISFGAAKIPFLVVWEGIFQFNPDINQHQIIQEMRLPRVLGGAMVGAGLAVAGAIMQGMTRNPLADTGLLGINAGAGLVLTLCFAFLPGLSYSQLITFSFMGAAVSVVLVYGIGSLARGGISPLRLVLAGSALSALMSALSEGISLYFQIGQDIAYWYAGGLSGTTLVQLKAMLPWFVAAIAGAIFLSRSITMLSLGDDVARGLGQRTQLLKLAGAGIVLVLAGSCVSLVGAVGFVGLMIPHLTRKLVGVDYRWIIPCSAVLGSMLIVLADLSARMINPPHETPVGALIALIGVPFFLYLARKERREL